MKEYLFRPGEPPTQHPSDSLRLRYVRKLVRENQENEVEGRGPALLTTALAAAGSAPIQFPPTALAVTLTVPKQGTIQQKFFA